MFHILAYELVKVFLEADLKESTELFTRCELCTIKTNSCIDYAYQAAVASSLGAPIKLNL